MSSPALSRASLALAVALSVGGLCLAAMEPRQQPVVQSPATTVDVVALDRDGRFVDGLGAADFAVTVDGARRNVTWVRRVSRGPGAMAEAASRVAAADPGVGVAAEAARTVLVVVDQASLLRGDERDAVQAVGLFLDRLGLNDRVAVVRVPLAPGTLVSLTSERSEVRAELSRVAGLLAPAPVNARAEPAALGTDERSRMTGLEAGQAARVDPSLASGAERGPQSGAGPLDALRSLLDTFRQATGRKVVAVFSTGLPGAGRAAIDETAQAAAAAHAVVYGFGLRAATGADTASPLTTAPLERLAAATGGSFQALGRNPGRAVERAAGELGACYVLGLEGVPPPDGRGARQALRVETARKGVTLRAGSWLAAAPDAGDRAVERPPAGPAGDPGAAPSVPAGREARAEAPRPSGKARDAELQLALARLFDYADGYERQYSMLVAEEDYRQSAGGGGVRLRSDLLLVRPENTSEWVSFRDVFEVDGKPVRDRDERLRKLFLEATPDAIARLEAIGEESARYNAGSVARTVNVPLLPLSFVRQANRGRFQYELDGRDDAGGVKAWRIRYTEQARPTIVADRNRRDVPVSGYFMVDTITGAVVETRMTAAEGDARAEITVRYRSEPALGLWVPVEMTEKYWQPDASGRRGLVSQVAVSGRATYSNFRRFQVTTEEKIDTPK